MHITFESESAFDLWNKTRRIERGQEYELVGVHYNKEYNPQTPWLLTAKLKNSKGSS